MASKLRRLGIVAALAVILLLGAVLLAFSYTEAGVTSTIESGDLSVSAHNLSAVPQSVVEDATMLAKELFGDYQEKSDDFVKQLLAVYMEARDKDFVIVFNPGGWGWGSAEASQGWWGILGGIASELDSSGYKSLLLNYQRTTDSFRGQIDESVEMLTFYPAKAKDLATRVEFLTTNIPELRVIVAGESNGTIISDSVMSILKDNPQVYSIQTGPPFWHENNMLDRTLVITNNGIIPDSFSQGNFLTMISSNLKALFGLYQPQDDSGTILYYIKAPGHEYRWQYPEVRAKITNFFERDIGIKW